MFTKPEAIYCPTDQETSVRIKTVLQVGDRRTERPQAILRSLLLARRVVVQVQEDSLFVIGPPPVSRQGRFAAFLSPLDPPLLARRGNARLTSFVRLTPGGLSK